MDGNDVYGLGFDGFVISDWNALGELPSDSSIPSSPSSLRRKDRARRAFNAGVDMVMATASSSDWKNYITDLTQLIEDEKLNPGTGVTEARLDDAVLRILKVKFELGLFENPTLSEEEIEVLDAKFGSEEHKAVAREAVSKSMVLLKNENDIINKLAGDGIKNILVAGQGANNIGIQCGGWTITWQGGTGISTPGTTLLNGFREVGEPKGKTFTYNSSGTLPDGTSVDNFDCAIVVIGETPYAEGDGDRQSGIPIRDVDKTTLDNIKATGLPTIVIMLSGRPMIIANEIYDWDAFIAAWLPGTEGAGVADVLFNEDQDFVGKLSYTWPWYFSQLILGYYYDGNPDVEPLGPLFDFKAGLTKDDTRTVATQSGSLPAEAPEEPVTPPPPPIAITAAGRTPIYAANFHNKSLYCRTEASSNIFEGVGQNIGYFDAGEWIEFNVDVEASGKYNATFNVSNGNSSTSAYNTSLLIDKKYLGSISVAPTGGWQNWTLIELPGIYLPAGEHVLKVYSGGSLNIHSIAFERTENASSQFIDDGYVNIEAGATNTFVPATNFTDFTNAATSNSSPSNPIRITKSGDGVGFINTFVLGSGSAARWIDYTVNSPAAGEYELKFNVGSAAERSNAIAIAVNNTTLADRVTVPATGGATTFADTAATIISLNEGINTIRVSTAAASSAAWNLNGLVISTVAEPEPPAITEGVRKAFVNVDFKDFVGSDKKLPINWTENFDGVSSIDNGGFYKIQRTDFSDVELKSAPMNISAFETYVVSYEFWASAPSKGSVAVKGTDKTYFGGDELDIPTGRTVVTDTFVAPGDATVELVFSLTGDAADVYIGSARLYKKDTELYIDMPDGIAPPLEISSDWTLTWQDEFSGDAVDDNKWVYQIGAGGWGNNELQYYRPENATVSDGKLTIAAKNESYNGASYTSTRMRTNTKFSQTYGRFEARISVPTDEGFWPAFWMMPETSEYGGWPTAGEIDIMEAKGRITDSTSGALHYAQSWPANRFTVGEHKLTEGDSTGNYHVYAVEWEPGELRWYVDGNLYQTVNNWWSKTSNEPTSFSMPAPFDRPFHMLLNVAVGGNFDGGIRPGDLGGARDAEMKVDYVRAYQLTGRDYILPKTNIPVEEYLPGSRTADATGNLVADNKYDLGLNPINSLEDMAKDQWNFALNTKVGAEATAEIMTSGTYNGLARVAVSKAEGGYEGIQLVQNVPIAKGKLYKLSFDVANSADHELNFQIITKSDKIAGTRTLSSTITHRSRSVSNYEAKFIAEYSSDANAELQFNFGHSARTVYLGNVRLEEIPSFVDNDVLKTPLSNGNYLYNGRFDLGDQTRLAYWNFNAQDNSATAYVDVVAKELEVDVTKVSALNDVTINQKGIGLESGYDYLVEFDAKVSSTRDISIALYDNDGKLVNTKAVTLSPETTSYKVAIGSKTTTTDNAAFEISFGGSVDKIVLDNIFLTRGELSGDDEEPISEGPAMSRLAASEGIVLLENNGVLPLKSTDKVAIFGHSRHMNGSSYPTDGFGKDGFITYGGGSGEVTAPYVVDLLEGMNNRKNEGKLQVVTDGGNNPSADTINTAAETHDVAVVVIRRWNAEASDLSAGAGGYLLSADETTMIQRVNDAFDKVVVVMNMGAALDMTWIENYENISAVLTVWFPGMEGGNAAADVLCGDVNPSGKLVDTFARNINDYPSTATFAQQHPQYTDDIYVGYRYFATADPDYTKVKYEFGYGLSYSTFDITEKSLKVDGDELVATAKVTNNGPHSGKEVLQVYYSAPQGLLNKPAYELAAFAKTSLLEVGESEVLEMRFAIDSMASYDDVGKTGVISAYVMEAGDYNIHIGNSIKNATKSIAAGKYTQDEFRVVEQLSKQLTPPTAFDRLIDPINNIYQSTDWIPESGAPTPGTPAPNPGPVAPVTPVPWTGEGTIMLEDVYKEPGYMYDFVAQMTDAELRTMSRHQSSSILTNGTGAIGKLPKYGIPEVNTADGPAGLRIGTIGARARIATCFPIATLLACTWNVELVEEVGSAVGTEMEEENVDIWLAPGLNIHRHPRNGRNFEYFSEDPLLSGKFTAAMTKGVQDKGGLVTIKHLAANNQETNRYNTNSQVSERALREIYLKGFEIAVKESDPGCVMTSYNNLNGSRTEASLELLTNILRNEWGFNGLVMTDWWNGRASSAAQIAAGCNVKMDDADSSINQVSREALEANIRVVMGTVLRSFAFAKEMSPDPRLTAIQVSPMHITVGKAASIDVTVTGRNLEDVDVEVGIKGYPNTFVNVPGNTGATVEIYIPNDLLSIGTYDVVMTMNGVESSLKASLIVDEEKEYIYLVAVRNDKIVGADPATFNNAANMTTMVANLDAVNDYAMLEPLEKFPERIHLRATNGLYVTMEGATWGNQMVRPRTAEGSIGASGWESLIFEDQDDGTVKIKRIGSDGTWYIDVAENGNLSTVQNSVGDTGKFKVFKVESVEEDPVITSVGVSPSQITEGTAVDLNVTVTGKYLNEAEVKVGIKGFENTFVNVPGDAGATVTVPVAADMLAIGEYDIVVMLNGTESSAKGSLSVVAKGGTLPAEGDTIYLVAVRNGKIVGSDSETFEPPVDNSQRTMVANLDEVNDYAKLTVSHSFDSVFLRATNNLYVTLEGAVYGDNKVRARSTEMLPGEWQTLIFEPQDDGTVKIKRNPALSLPDEGTWYVDVAENGELRTVQDSVGDSGKFKIVIL